MYVSRDMYVSITHIMNMLYRYMLNNKNSTCPTSNVKPSFYPKHTMQSYGSNNTWNGLLKCAQTKWQPSFHFWALSL